MNDKPKDPTDDGTCDRSGEQMLHDCCRELGVNMAMALQIVAWADENFGGGQCQTASTETIQKLISRQRQAWHILVAYQANQKTVQDMIMSTRCMALEMGYYTVSGADNVAELARQLGIKKQTVNKCANSFQSKMGLPPRPGQRCEAARANMTEARIEQLSKEPPHPNGCRCQQCE